MFNLISGSCLIRAATLCIGFGLLYAGLAVAAHAAQSEEDSFASDLEILTIQHTRSGADWLPPYKFGASVVLTRSPDTAPIGSGFGSAHQALAIAKPQQETIHAINAHWPQSYDSDRVSLPRLLRVEFKVEQVKITFRPQSALIEGERFKVTLQPHSASMLWNTAF